MERTSPETNINVELQEEANSDIVTILNDEIQKVTNIIKEAINEEESKINFLK